MSNKFVGFSSSSTVKGGCVGAIEEEISGTGGFGALGIREDEKKSSPKPDIRATSGSCGLLENRRDASEAAEVGEAGRPEIDGAAPAELEGS